MKEDIFFKVGYTTYLQKSKNKKRNWTSKIIKKFFEHKIISTSIVVIIMCLGINFWLIYKFINILEMNKIF